MTKIHEKHNLTINLRKQIAHTQRGLFWIGLTAPGLSAVNISFELTYIEILHIKFLKYLIQPVPQRRLTQAFRATPYITRKRHKSNNLNRLTEENSY